jgi:rare lipoprotein A
MDRFLTIGNGSFALLRRFARLESGQFVLIALASLTLVIGCTPTNKMVSGGNDNAKSLKGNNPFYEVYGERYYVLSSSKGYAQEGVASWYGKQFHGKLTSNGEIYNMHDMTAAHKTLPLPSTVRVTNLRNGRSVIVRVNDRGPFVDNRLIDMSYAAATQLDMVQSGTTLVRVETLDNYSRNEPVRYDTAAADFGTIYMQVGAFGERNNAVRLADKLSAAGVSNVSVYNENGMFKVRIGPIADVQAYDSMVGKVASLEIGKPHLVVELEPR